MSHTSSANNDNNFEHSLPLFWPCAAAVKMGEVGLKLLSDNLRFVTEVEAITSPHRSTWATKNTVLLDLDTMLLRDFSEPGSSAVPVLIDAPYAGHSATIADYDKGQSLVETLKQSGLQRIFVTDWKPATDAMKQFDIDKYLAELNVVVDELGGKVHLVGLCQGGWLSAMYAARYPAKVRSIVLAGAPIDTQAGDGPLKKMVQSLPANFYADMVQLGHGRMLGKTMLAGWKGMNPGDQYLQKYVDLYQHIDDDKYLNRTELFEGWYENPVDLPGTYYLQIIEQLFKANHFFHHKFIGLGKLLWLKDICCPAYLLAGDADDITPHQQVFAAETALGTPAANIVKELVPGGHIGLFMGKKTLQEHWTKIGSWILAQD